MATFALLALSVGTDTGAEECVYLVGRALEVMRGATSHAIPLDDRGEIIPVEVVLGEGKAFVSYQRFERPGQVVEVDLVSRTIGRTFDVGSGQRMAYANGKVYIPNPEAGTLTAIDVAGGTQREIGGPWARAPGRLVASADGSALFAGSFGVVYVLDTASDEVATSFVAGPFSEIAVDGWTVLAAGSGVISAFEPGDAGYAQAWQVEGTGFAWSMEVAGGRVFSSEYALGGPVVDVSLAPPHVVTVHSFIVGPQIEQLMNYLGGGADRLYATSIHGLHTLALDSGEISLIREPGFAFDVDVGPCYGTPEPTRTATATPTPSELEPSGAEECIYVTDDGDDSLVILHGEWEYRIPLEKREPKGIAIGGGVAYVNHGECCDEGAPVPPRRVSVIDLPRKTVVGDHYLGATIHDIAFARGKLYVAALGGGGVRIIDPATGERGVISGGVGSRLAVNPDETRLFIGSGNAVRMFDLERGTLFGGGLTAGSQVMQVAAHADGVVAARADMTLGHYARMPSGGYVSAWEVRNVGFSKSLVVAGGRVFSAAMDLVPLRTDEGALVDVPLDAPENRRVHYLRQGAALGLQSLAVDTAGEYVYAVGGLGLHRFSLSTSEAVLLRASHTFERVRLAPCPGEPGPTWTVTRTATETATRTPSSSATARSTATATATAAPPASTATPTSTPPPPASVTPAPSHTLAATPAIPGDADCDGVLTESDAGATITAMFDPIAHAACSADCDRDGGVRSADLLCAIAARAAP